jgi:glucose-1-phosphate thymidylyltransferase
MIGILLCGGLGTRLLPLTRAINKHLLPVGGQPMCFYPLRKMAEAGIKRVVIVVGGKSTGEIIQTIRDGHDLGLTNVAYVYQEGEGGIAAALSCAREWNGGEDICVVLGDTIFDFSLGTIIEDYSGSQMQGHVVLSRVEAPQHYGVAEFTYGPHYRSLVPNTISVSTGPVITRIIEKPTGKPPSDFAVIGVYLYRSDIFDRIRELTPSARGELEISDLNSLIAADKLLGYSTVSADSWFDAGISLEALIQGTSWLKRKYEGVK